MRPLVSIGMTAYNHEKYIRKSLDSILMQKVDFKYEIVIGEDCSQDNTRNIIKEYADKYPDVIKVIFHKENVGMKENYIHVRNLCTGIYRTTLEGDDYWLNDDHLQKQVEFLETHSDYVAIVGKWLTIDDDGKKIKNPFEHAYTKKKIYTIKDVQKGLLSGHTCTMLYRNIYLNMENSVLEAYTDLEVIGDRKLNLLLCCYGNIYCSDEVISVRRILKKSTTSYYNVSKQRNMYPIMYKWSILMKNFAIKQYGIDIDFSDLQKYYWIQGIKHLLLLPCTMHFKAVISLFLLADGNRMCLIKHTIFKVYWYLKNIYGKEGFFIANKKLILKMLRIPIRIYRYHKNLYYYNKCKKEDIGKFL